MSSDLMISREELDGLTRMFAEFKESSPIKMTYDNIVIYKFNTHTSFNTIPMIQKMRAPFAKKIDQFLSEFKGIDSVQRDRIGYSWTVKIRYITLQLCLHSYVEYDQSDLAFDDTAINRVVVSPVAHFDAKYTYGLDAHNEEVFGSLNRLYVDLQHHLTTDKPLIDLAQPLDPLVYV